MTAVGNKRQWLGLVPAGYSLTLALVVLGPLLRSGYLLLRDAVSTPRSYLTDAALGVGDAAPRAVPQDALVAAVSSVVDGGFLVKAILVAALWLAGWGAAVLARELLRVALGPQLVAATVAVWNPYVGERLLQGHWSLLTGYAALPWIAVLANRLRGDRDSEPGDRFDRVRLWAILGGCWAAAGLTPTGSLLAGLTGLLLVGRRNLIGAAALWVATALPWLTATALSGAGGDPSDPAGVAAFAARAEPGLGTIGSLAGLGGIWNSTAVPDSRTTIFALIGTLILLTMVVSGLRRVATEGDRNTLHVRRILLVLAAIAIVLPALGATGWGLAAGEFLVVHVPGAGLLRDTQKYVALAVPAFALCAAAGCGVLAEKLAGRGRMPAQSHSEAESRAHRNPAPGSTDEPSAPTELATTATNGDRLESATDTAGISPKTPYLAALFIALLIAALPDLAWGVGGALRPVHYPPGWQRVATLVDTPGDIAVLPGGMFRKFRYSGSAPVLDPAPRMLPRDVLQTGELPVRGATVTGEGARAREVEQLLLRGGSPTALARLGVGWVLVEGETPGPLGESKTTLAQLTPVYTDPAVQLYRIPGPITDHDATPTARRTAGAAHLLWAALLATGVLAAITPTRHRNRPQEPSASTEPSTT
ncbi:hypothetical protein [Nocardia uniformis]|uniref:hypothetical protein n=1 Tax=Nocardia uniformis TaxID=53432 RepID=UPI000B205A9B|nr:hypothetical protein [Nocardia uniformis]